MRKLDTNDCFLEAHYYSSGLRIDPLGVSNRPSWAPDADLVGFRDEFELPDGDCAIETRRFAMGSDLVTWVGVYRRSVDATLGDRSNHAGVGAWFRSAVPFDYPGLLHGLDVLAQELARELDPKKMGEHGLRFGEKFLPLYGMRVDDLEPSTGFPFADSGIVETKIETVHIDDSMPTTRPLSDYMAFTAYLKGDPIAPRILVRATSDRKLSATIKDDFSFTTLMLQKLPEIRREDRDQARMQAEKVAAANAKCAELTEQLTAVQSEASELSVYKSDPQRAVSQRLDALTDEIRALQNRMRAPEATVAWQPPIQRGNGRSGGPIRPPSNAARTPEVSEDTAARWLYIGLIVAVAVLVAILLYFAIDALVPLVMGAIRGN